MKFDLQGRESPSFLLMKRVTITNHNTSTTTILLRLENETFSIMNPPIKGFGLICNRQKIARLHF